MPASSLYWIQKSASSVSSAAGNRSRAASPGVKPSAAAAELTSNPLAAAPDPTANPFSKKDRRLNEMRDAEFVLVFLLPSGFLFSGFFLGSLTVFIIPFIISV